MLSRDHNILWLPESNGYPTRTILGATLVSTTMRVDRKRAGDLSLSCPAAHLEEVPGPAKE